MNLVNEYLKTSIKDLLERYHLTGYRTISEIRMMLLSEYKFESVRVRELPGRMNQVQSWELKVNGKTYFYDCDSRRKTLEFTGVR